MEKCNARKCCRHHSIVLVDIVTFAWNIGVMYHNYK